MSCCVVRGLLGDGLRTTSMLFLLDIDIDYMGTFQKKFYCVLKKDKSLNISSRMSFQGTKTEQDLMNFIGNLQFQTPAMHNPDATPSKPVLPSPNTNLCSTQCGPNSIQNSNAIHPLPNKSIQLTNHTPHRRHRTKIQLVIYTKSSQWVRSPGITERVANDLSQINRRIVRCDGEFGGLARSKAVVTDADFRFANDDLDGVGILGSFGHEDVKVLGVASHGGEGGCQCGDGHEGGDEGGTHDEA